MDLTTHTAYRPSFSDQVPAADSCSRCLLMRPRPQAINTDGVDVQRKDHRGATNTRRESVEGPRARHGVCICALPCFRPSARRRAASAEEAHAARGHANQYYESFHPPNKSLDLSDFSRCGPILGCREIVLQKHSVSSVHAAGEPVAAAAGAGRTRCANQEVPRRVAAAHTARCATPRHRQVFQRKDDLARDTPRGSPYLGAARSDSHNATFARHTVALPTVFFFGRFF